MACIVMAYMVMAYMVMAYCLHVGPRYIVMALYSYGLYGYGLYGPSSAPPPPLGRWDRRGPCTRIAMNRSETPVGRVLTRPNDVCPRMGITLECDPARDGGVEAGQAMCRNLTRCLGSFFMAYIGMAYIVMAYIAMAYMGMAYVVMADVLQPDKVLW